MAAKEFRKGTPVSLYDTVNRREVGTGKVVGRTRFTIEVEDDKERVWLFGPNDKRARENTSIVLRPGAEEEERGTRTVALDEDVAWEVYTQWLQKRYNGDLKAILTDLGVTVVNIEELVAGELRTKA